MVVVKDLVVCIEFGGVSVIDVMCVIVDVVGKLGGEGGIIVVGCDGMVVDIFNFFGMKCVVVDIVGEICVVVD